MRFDRRRTVVIPVGLDCQGVALHVMDVSRRNPVLLVSQLFCTDQSARCELRFSFVTWRADTPYTSCTTTPLSQTKDNALSNVASGSHCATKKLKFRVSKIRRRFAPLSLIRRRGCKKDPASAQRDTAQRHMDFAKPVHFLSELLPSFQGTSGKKTSL